MDSTTKVALVVVALVVVGGLYLASQSPAAGAALGGSFGMGEPAGRDYTATDTALLIGAGGSALGDIIGGVAALYGGGAASGAAGAMAAAGGTAKGGIR